ncbi:Plant self-incompatibility protein S1 family [Striga hermonthica]|uniref:S-protein homolog n=1 Tax=Striga hermonthica TaxID=68872 RepID=A0A9N7R757_STRHE|nr:Plant self-incompatibility protein S1 family [Striga hermonthica]
MNTCTFLVIISFFSLINIVALSSGARELILNKSRVLVSNGLRDDNITIHCYSSDDDLGTHQLTYGANFSWHFRTNLFDTTKFYCDFNTKYGSGKYGVFTWKLSVDYCGNFCIWIVVKVGPCLQADKKYVCQDWKNPPKTLS